MQNLLLGRQLMSVYKPIKNEAGVAAAAALALARGESLDSVTSEFSFESSTINNGTKTARMINSMILLNASSRRAIEWQK